MKLMLRRTLQRFYLYSAKAIQADFICRILNRKQKTPPVGVTKVEKNYTDGFKEILIKIKGEGLLTLHLYYGKYHPLV
jgi:hypothetical protein